MIRLSRPWLGEEESDAVRRVLDSGMLVQGERVLRFETRLAELSGRKHGIAVSNGTSALELALRALGIGPGDEVLVPALTWPSPAHAVCVVGAEPVLVDVHETECNAVPAEMARARTNRTKAAILIDQFGNPARWPAVALALPDLPVIADAACALGSSLNGQPCGSMGAIACMSFHPRKVITTGEGGVCLTNDDELASKLRWLRNHGQSGPGVFVGPSGNDRMSEVAAAIGNAQLDKLPALLEKRRALAAAYMSRLRGLIPTQIVGAQTNFQTVGLLLGAKSSRGQRDAVIANMKAKGVEVGIFSYALHRLPSLKGAAEQAKKAGRSFHNAEGLVDRAMALPLHHYMNEADVERIVQMLSEELGKVGASL